MAKAEISWRRETEDGEKLNVYAQRVGGRWIFYQRRRRFDCWALVPEPGLEDWMELLDAVRRRAQRRLYPPAEVDRVEQTIRQRYPEADLKE